MHLFWAYKPNTPGPVILIIIVVIITCLLLCNFHIGFMPVNYILLNSTVKYHDYSLVRLMTQGSRATTSFPYITFKHIFFILTILYDVIEKDDQGHQENKAIPTAAGTCLKKIMKKALLITLI